jgi:hypothetical protein
MTSGFCDFIKVETDDVFLPLFKVGKPFFPEKKNHCFFALISWDDGFFFEGIGFIFQSVQGETVIQFLDPWTTKLH